MTASLYQHDLPYCALPSLHVAYSVYCAYWSAHLFPAAAPFFIAFSALIIVSTLFVKQHVLADVAGGMTVAALSLAVMGFIL
jgi:membrane-associated phospholipid phosphatase